MARLSRTLAALLEDKDLIPRTHTAAQTVCKSSSRGWDAHF